MDLENKENLINQVKQRFDLMADSLSEKDKRLWTALEANTNDVKFFDKADGSHWALA